jgi:hypothetical protein
MMGSRAQIGGKDKTVFSVDGSMFLKPIMRFFIFNSSVGIKVTGEFFRITDLVQFTFRALRCFEFFQFVFGNGPAGRLDQAGIHSNAFIDREAKLMKLFQQGTVNLNHSLFGDSFAES